MFKIDKSSVEYIDSIKSSVVIKHWASGQDTAPPALSGEPRAQAAADQSQTVRQRPPADRQTPVPDPDKIIKEAYMQADQIRTNAFKEGYAAGMEEAKAKMQSLVREKTVEWNNIKVGLEEFRTAVIEELEENILQLSFDIAEKIVNIQLEKDDIVFINIVKKAIESLKAKEKFIIRLNETQFMKYFKDGWAWLADEMQCAPFMVSRDCGVKPYGCIVESEEGIVYAGAEDQLNKLKSTLKPEERQDDEVF